MQISADDVLDGERWHTSKMCKRFVRLIARKWIKFGLLESIDGAIRKNRIFEAAWHRRRFTWIMTVHHGSTAGLIEICQHASSTWTSKNLGEKRVSYPFFSSFEIIRGDRC